MMTEAVKAPVQQETSEIRYQLSDHSASLFIMAIVISLIRRPQAAGQYVTKHVATLIALGRTELTSYRGEHISYTNPFHAAVTSRMPRRFKPTRWITIPPAAQYPSQCAAHRNNTALVSRLSSWSPTI